MIPTVSAPRIGDIVHYQSYGTPGGEYKAQPRAAIVTQVFVDPAEPDRRDVGLCILNPTGLFLNERVPFAVSPTPGHWNYRLPAREVETLLVQNAAGDVVRSYVDVHRFTGKREWGLHPAPGKQCVVCGIENRSHP